MKRQSIWESNMLRWEAGKRDPKNEVPAYKIGSFLKFKCSEIDEWVNSGMTGLFIIQEVSMGTSMIFAWQDRNPGVPGIIYKICPENEELRKLEQARDLWKTTAELTGQPIKEIYAGKDIPAKDLSIDHFVPRSYISNDELWNLIPMRKSLNSSKNNKLPPWEIFFLPFVRYQFYLYGLIFPQDADRRSQLLIRKFEKCRKNNLNAI